MIYDEDEYKIIYFKRLDTKEIPVWAYIESLNKKEQAKVFKYVEHLRQNEGCLDEPYSRHIRGKIRELRVDFAKNRHRIFYFIFIGKNIIMLHAFLKKTAKTPEPEIKKAETNYQQVLINKNTYE
ncbi:type II toxin-antitoxin system RelE/ParE family toxin [Candidatus Uhrbacteria bacterium]|nr:type II toxin-antitoxin system RelE/ParE family toxin [Candidatus Uhrbacteria bacterium]